MYWSLCCHVAFKQRWWWEKISFTPNRHWFLRMLDTKWPWQLTEMNDCEQTAPPIYWHLWKARKDYLRKFNHHKANEPFRPRSLWSLAGERQVKMYCGRLERVLFVMRVRVQLEGLQVCSLLSNTEKSTVKICLWKQIYERAQCTAAW